MNERFKQCLKVILQNEGGFVDRKDDRGGRTNFGITQRVYDEFSRSRKQPERDVKFIHESEVETIYYTNYWLAASCHRMSEPLDLLVFDFAVNSGVTKASKTLQLCVGVDVDGKIGKNTIEGIANFVMFAGLDDLCKRYLIARSDYFEDIVRRDPTQQVFLKGWKNRIAHLEKEINLA